VQRVHPSLAPRLLLLCGALLSAILLSAFAGGCQHELPLAPGSLATVIFEPGAGFFDAPFPSDARRNEDGAPIFTGLPNPGGIGFVKQAITAVSERDGFDPTGAIYLRFDRALPLPTERDLSTKDEVPGVELVDIDPRSPDYLRRFPAWVRVTGHHDGVRPANLLQLLPVPGIGVRENTTYAAIVKRDLNNNGSADLGLSARVQALLLEGDHKSAGDAWRSSFAPLRAALTDLGMRAEDIAAATVFTTGEPTAELFRWTEQALAGPAPELVGPLVREREHEDFVVLRGLVRLPIYQDGAPPHFFGGGRMQLDDDGRPVAQRTEEAPFYITIPKGDVPADGVPLYFYIHGTGGKATQALDRGYRRSVDDVAPLGSGLASWVAPVGFGTSCIAGTYSPDRIGWRALDGYSAYMFFNPVAWRDNLRQMILEQVLFLRLLDDLVIDNALVPEAHVTAADGKLRFSKSLRVVGGQSLGSFLSGMVAALTARFDATVLTGAGGSWIEFGFGVKDPVDLTALLDVLAMERGEHLDRHHPFITAVQTAVGPSDNTLYTPYIVRRPREGAKVPHVLVIEGERDLQVPLNLQRTLVLSIGADLVGPDAGDRPSKQLSPILHFGGLKHVPGGLAGNRLAPDGTKRTAVVVRHEEDGILEGHYVLFQREEARTQLVNFIESVRKGEVPHVQ